MRSPLADVVDGYAELGSWLLERWSVHASAVAKKLDAGGYDADSAAADVARTAALTAESGFLLASEAFDAMAILTGRQCEPHLVESELFSTLLAGAILTLAGPLVSGHGDTLAARLVSCVPSQLGPKETEFCLRADATGHHGGTYVGTVTAARPGAPDDPVIVWITVP